MKMAENYFDPVEGVPLRQDAQSSDMSKSGVRKAWDEFSASPENRAALLQFGLSMMAPRPKGSGFLGGVANAVGEGAEAATRNIGAQQAEAELDSKVAERESTAEYRSTQGKAALMNAAAYGRQVDQMGSGGPAGRQQLSHIFRVQQAFRTWMAKPEDTTGLEADPLLGAIKREFPEVTTKADLLRNEKARQRAFQLFGAQMTTEVPDSGGAGAPVATSPPAAQPAKPGVAAPPMGRQTRTFYDQATGAPKTFEWNGTQWVPIQ